MSWFDLIIIAIISISALISLIRGFVKESISLMSWLVAGFIAFRYFTPLASLLEPYIESPTLRTGIGFSILFVCSLIVGAAVNFMASRQSPGLCVAAPATRHRSTVQPVDNSLFQ